MIATVGWSAAHGSAPEQSVRPTIRYESYLNTSVQKHAWITTVVAPAQSLRPIPRSRSKTHVPKTFINGKKRIEDSATTPDQVQNNRPLMRLLNPFSKRKKKGSICGIPDIQGSRQNAIPGRLRGCGISDPVRITAIAGVKLSQPSVMNCETAKALHSWVKNSVRPATKRKGGGVVGLQVAAHYSCRTRNNRKGAKISEHGKGRAIDISGLQLRDGTTLTVLKDWNSRNRKIMRKIHKQACGPFGTVLGPNSDRYHKDHFHFDTARYRSGPYCR